MNRVEAMRNRFRRGLVVGKFCPLHRGHMLVIDRAIADCDEVLVISYTKPGFADCGRALRQAWMDALYPQVRSLVIDEDSLPSLCARRGVAPLPFPPNDAPATVHRAFTGWLCWNLGGGAVDAVFTSEDYGDGFAAAMSRHFSACRGVPHPVAHVCVDRARDAVPISGTALRRDPHAHRAFLDPRVYAHFVERVCLLGGESSGKTTLAKALAARLGTAWVPEAGRARWEAQDGRLDYADMRIIAADQLALEDRLARQARRWLVCDGSALTTAFYSQHDYGRVDPLVRVLARKAYAHTVVCAPDFSFVQDGTRRDAAFRERQHGWYLDRLEHAGIPYNVLHGPLEARVGQALHLLGQA
jgi:HTH-type transcriptional repressor of NAD biosynthesis genes